MKYILLKFRPFLAPFVLTLIIFSIYFNPDFATYLALEAKPLNQQLWQIFTTHLVHLNTLHLFMNLAVFWILVVAFRQYVQGRLLMNVMLFSALFATLTSVILGGEYLFVGLSGVLHGVVVYVAFKMHEEHPWLARALLTLVVLKLISDVIRADSSPIWLEAQVAYLTHIGGAIGGLIAVPSLKRKSKEALEILKNKTKKD